MISVTHGSPAEYAGLWVRDELVQVGTHTVVPGPKAVEELLKYLARVRTDASSDRLPIVVRRSGAETRIELTMDKTCNYRTVVTRDGELNAYADGSAVFVTSAMMRFADDRELAAVIAHEISHNAMGHIDAKMKNAAFAGFFGLLADVAMAYSGVNTGGYHTNQMMQAGAMIFSQDFENEADYVGMYILARADKPLDGAPNIWRHMAMANPGSIAMASSHPTTAERFVRMEKAIEEIEAKLAAGAELSPELRSQA